MSKCIPVHFAVSPEMAEFNRAHKKVRTYERDRLADAGNIILDPEGRDLQSLLREAADLLDNYGSVPEVVADVHAFLSQSKFLLPKVQCWVVVKEYTEPDPTSAFHGRRTNWIGCHTKAQAKSFAEAIAAFYAGKYRHHRPDRFVVERGTIEVTQMVLPTSTAADHVRALS